jgi:hypothetical protein
MDAIGRHPSSLNSKPALKPVQVSLFAHESSTNSYAYKMFAYVKVYQINLKEFFYMIHTIFLFE